MKIKDVVDNGTLKHQSCDDWSEEGKRTCEIEEIDKETPLRLTWLEPFVQRRISAAEMT